MGAYKLRLRYGIVFLFLCISIRVHGQSNTRILERTVQFSYRNIRLDTLLQGITRQTGIRFSYNSRRLNTSYKLTLTANPLPVRQVLDALKRLTGVSYVVIENQVILNIEKSTVQKPVKQETKPPGTQPKPERSPSLEIATHQDSARTVQRGPLNLSGDTLKLAKDPVRVPSDSAFNPTSVRAVTSQNDSSIALLQTLPGNSGQLNIDPVQEQKVASPMVQKVLPENQQFFIDAGVSTEETLFLGATLTAGIPAIHASVSVKSNGKATVVLYGIGTSFRIREKSRVMLSGYYGSYAKGFTRTEINQSDTTTVAYDLRVEGAWLRAGLGMEWSLNANGSLKIYAGLNFNALESRYKVNGKDSGPGVLSTADPERKFSAFYPFYTITNTYNDIAATSWKTWTGIQLGINITLFHK